MSLHPVTMSAFQQVSCRLRCSSRELLPVTTDMIVLQAAKTILQPFRYTCMPSLAATHMNYACDVSMGCVNAGLCITAPDEPLCAYCVTHLGLKPPYSIAVLMLKPPLSCIWTHHWYRPFWKRHLTCELLQKRQRCCQQIATLKVACRLAHMQQR